VRITVISLTVMLLAGCSASPERDTIEVLDWVKELWTDHGTSMQYPRYYQAQPTCFETGRVYYVNEQSCGACNKDCMPALKP